MKLLVITNYNHKVSKQLIQYLEFKKIDFDYIDSSKKKKIKITREYDYLISFLNSVYIDKNMRKKIKKNSYNFHPGPPEYPGFGCYNFALLDSVSSYGCTVHLINDNFDNGKILRVNKFKVSFKKMNLYLVIENRKFEVKKMLLNLIVINIFYPKHL